MQSKEHLLPLVDPLDLERKKLCSLVFDLLANKSISGRPHLDAISMNATGSRDHSSSEVICLFG